MDMTLDVQSVRSWVEISKKNLLANYQVFKKLVGKNCQIACVVKANAYGHGLKEVVSLLSKNHINRFAVDSLEEALLVRQINPQAWVLVMGYIPLSSIEKAVKGRISFVVSNQETMAKIIKNNLRQKAKIHLKIETGLNRQGILPKDLTKFLKIIKKYPHLFVLEGASTHFANIEDTLDPGFAQEQLSRFKKAVVFIRRKGFRNFLAHSAASAAAILYPQTHFSMIRLGISLYGLWPSKETELAFKLKKKKLNLKPVLSWKTIVTQIKGMETGESVGYGRTWYASRPTRIAVIPVGYSDGFDRKLSNKGRVLIKGRFCPVVGRVAMNMAMIDITDNPHVCLEDKVTLIGRERNQEIAVEEIAQRIDTINYEVVARINPTIKRIVV